MEFFTLSNGVKVPAIGSGTNSFAKTDGVYTGYTGEVVSAVKAGYIHFDTAESYGNEEAVGNGIIESGIGRENIFITTKMRTKMRDGSTMTYDRKAAEDAIARSLDKLKTDYIDLYLIHMPVEEDFDANFVLWEVFEEYYQKGILKAIGVSNFKLDQIRKFVAGVKIAPMVDQIKIAPGKTDFELIGWLQAHDIVPMAWGPLKFEEGQKMLSVIGQNYDKTWAQVLLNYNWRKGYISIPKAHSYDHQKANLDVFDFTLTDDEIRYIDQLSK